MEKEEVELAILFHNTYERLAPSFGYETREDTKSFDINTPNGKLMISVCKEIIKWQQDISKTRNKKTLNQNKMTPKEKAKELVNMFDFNGYCLNESNLETSKKFAEKATSLIICEIDNQYQVNYWYEVLNEIKNFKSE